MLHSRVNKNEKLNLDWMIAYGVRFGNAQQSIHFAEPLVAVRAIPSEQSQSAMQAASKRRTWTGMR
jgi:hypothetical protein